MHPLDPDDPEEAPIPGLSPRGDGQRKAMLDPLVDLLAGLDRLRGGNDSIRRDNGTPTIWQDNDNIYIEAVYEKLRSLDIDICVYDGKVFIRMGQ